ncbi:hypothetical protein [Vibrio rhodolitus]|uniref:hypothetical protein n=1 Tax=Vibrio rhodolitus TaxID=2231649 RepID=UPI000F4D2BD6|nr:hypothetical protein [Vibrio rhodolitus]
MNSVFATVRSIVIIMAALFIGSVTFGVNAYTLSWTSTDDSVWYYTATLSHPSFKKVSSYHEGIELKTTVVPVQNSTCNVGTSQLYSGNLYSRCGFVSGHSSNGSPTEKPYSHWYYLEQPMPVEPYWSGSVLEASSSSKQSFGPLLPQQSLANIEQQEGDGVTWLKLWSSSYAWTRKSSAHIIYLSRELIESDMFGKKTRVQNTVTQRLHMTDPVKTSDGCCDTGIYEHSLSYEITLQKYPLLVTLPSHVDMGEVLVGAESESQVIPVSVSANNNPVQIVPGTANISFERIKKLSANHGGSSCDAMVQVSNENGQVNSGEIVDLHSFRNGINARIINTQGCDAGAYDGVLAFTVAWK